MSVADAAPSETPAWRRHAGAPPAPPRSLFDSPRHTRASGRFLTNSRKLALSGAALAAPVAAAGPAGLLPGCPVLAITGIPCPTCGGTRAVHLLFEGDPDFLRYNAFWAVVVAIAWAWSALMLWRTLRGRPALGPVVASAIGGLRARPAAIALGAVALAAVGWVTAMVNLETIRPL